MTDDIVTRLRMTSWTKLSWDIQEAVDEIEKLRDKCKHLEAEIARLGRLSNG